MTPKALLTEELQDIDRWLVRISKELHELADVLPFIHMRYIERIGVEIEQRQVRIRKIVKVKS